MKAHQFGKLRIAVQLYGWSSFRVCPTIKSILFEPNKPGLSAMNTLPVILLAVSIAVSVPSSVKLSGKDLGQRVEMTVGGVLEIILEGNPTTGYVWAVASVDEKILKQVGKTEFTPAGKARGSGGRIVMRFEAAKVGETRLNLIYHRPFEKNKPPIKTFEVKINVQ